MNFKIEQLEPSEVWRHFKSLTQIPRPSKHEESVIEFMKKFGEGLGLDTTVDEVGNVIIKKPATPGYENKKGIILQGHLDMVPQKNSDKDHDFTKHPIEAYIDGEWVTANGTTLGADNGMGVAATMAVLESKTLKHGPVEGLFTSDEETGMTGANGLKPGLLDGEILLNLDSEDEGELYIGCAGGVDTNITFGFSVKPVPANHKAFLLSVTGLKGGHSGLDIHLNRGNACLIMNQLLADVHEKFNAQLAEINAGSLRNAIPREAFATVVIPEAMAEEFQHFVFDFGVTQKTLFQKSDPELAVNLENAKLPSDIIDEATQLALYQSVAVCPNGVIAMSKDMEGIVETSSNLAIIKSDKGEIKIAILTRSAIDGDRDVAASKIASVFKKTGAKTVHDGAYPGWKPNINSPILEAMKNVYNNNFGKIPEVKVIHAGLECGILGAAYPHWDMISFGPTIRFPHSPDEKVNIKSVQLFWDFLLKTLEEAPEKAIS
jgi:dipeptidase D